MPTYTQDSCRAHGNSLSAGSDGVLFHLDGYDIACSPFALFSPAETFVEQALQRLIEAHPNQMNPKRILQTVILLTFSGSLLFAAGKPEVEAQKAAEQWLSLVDAAKFAESWQSAAAYFQAALAQDQWERTLGAVRKPLGDLVSRKLKSATYATTLPGAPDGEYVVLQFDTSFTNKKVAIETVTPMREKDGQWKVSGYFIK